MNDNLNDNPYDNLDDPEVIKMLNHVTKETNQTTEVVLEVLKSYYFYYVNHIHGSLR